MKKIRIEPKTKPKGARDWIAWQLVSLAKWIRPSNEAAMTYLMELFHEYKLEEMKYGRAELEIKVKKIHL